MITNFDTKCKVWLHRSSSAKVTLPTEAWGYWNQWGMIGIQSDPWGISIANSEHYFEIINNQNSNFGRMQDAFYHRILLQISTSQKKSN